MFGQGKLVYGYEKWKKTVNQTSNISNNDLTISPVSDDVTGI